MRFEDAMRIFGFEEPEFAEAEPPFVGGVIRLRHPFESRSSARSSIHFKPVAAEAVDT